MDYPSDGLVDGMLAIEMYLQRNAYERKKAISAIRCLQRYARNARPHPDPRLHYLWPRSKHGERICSALGCDFRLADYASVRRALLGHVRVLRQIAQGREPASKDALKATKLVLGELSSGINSIAVSTYLEHWRRLHPGAVMLAS